MRIAIPSDDHSGLEAAISDHFGHAPAFTLINVEDGAVATVEVLENGGHDAGGCMAPVTLLKDNGVEILIAGGMGVRPLAGFHQVGIKVFYNEGAATVGEAVERFLDDGCREFGEAQTCGGGEGHCGGHHHESVEREPIDGPHDVRAERVITLGYVLLDSGGEMIDSSDESEPMRYLHGAEMIIPALEKALDGLEEGASVKVELAAEEAFGQRDENRVLEVSRDQLPDDIQVGAMVAAEDPQGNHVPLTVVALDDESARLDGNHQLAGIDVVFEIDVLKVENATAEEIAHGHVH